MKEKKKLLDDAHSATVANTNVTSAAHASPSALVQLSTGSGLDLVSSTPVETQNLRRVLRDYELKLSKLEALNDESRREATRLQQQLSGYKHNAQAQAFEKLDKEFRRTRAQADEAKKRVVESDAELLRTKVALRERDTKIQQMKGEYNKLFHALQKVKIPASGNSSSSASSSSPGMLARRTSTSSLGSNGANNGTTKLKVVASTSSLLPSTSSRGSTVSVESTATSANNNVTTAMSSSEAMTRLQANDNPYLLEHYKARLEALEKEIEGFKVQIRKMIASEYRYKQKNRLFRLEKSQLVDTCDRLRLELDKAVLSSAKTITNAQKQQTLTSSYCFSNSRSDGSLLTSAQQLTATRSSFRQRQSDCSTGGSGGGSAVSEVKKLRQRNLFLEERFRAIVASAAAAKNQTSSSGDGDLKSRRRSVLLRPQSAAAGLTLKTQKLTPEALTMGNGFEGDQSSESDLDGSDGEDDEDTGSSGDNQFSVTSSSQRQIRRQCSIMAIRQALESQAPLQPNPVAPALDVSALNGVDSFKSLDTDTLQALQQVKTKARVRPQSAQRPPSLGGL